MSLVPSRLTISAIAAACLSHGVAQDGAGVTEGDVAPDFTCTDWLGAPLSWEELGGSPVLLFFHAPALSPSTRVFTDLLELLRKETETRARLEVVLVLNDGSRAAELADALAERSIRGRVVVDPERAVFAGYRVIAFPSAFCLTPERRVAGVVKGAGPITGYRILLGCKLAAGLLEAGEYRDLVSGRSRAETDPARVRATRFLNLARSLLVAGRTGEALEPLLAAEAAVDGDPEILSALALVLLELGREADARARLEHLARLSPEAADTHLLRARLALLTGDLAAARAELQAVDPRSTEARFVRGMVLEAEGDWEAAAKLHRRTLGPLMWRERLPRRGDPPTSDPTRDD